MPSFSRSDIVTLFVGPDKIQLKAHKDLLCAKSKFFKACLENFSEAADLIVNLPDDNITAVEAFVNWSYTGKYTYTCSLDEFLTIYKFADKIMAESYCNDIVDGEKSNFRVSRIHDELSNDSEALRE